MATMSRLRRLCSNNSTRLLILAVAVRAGVLLIAHDNLAADPDGYRSLARNLLEQRTFGRGTQPTAYRPPLYPLLLTVCETGLWNALVATAALHLALGVATVAVTLYLGKSWGLARRSYLAALLVAFDPILLHQSTLVMTETFSTLLAVLALAFVSAAALAAGRRRLVLSTFAGAVYGLAALCRPTFLAALVLIAVTLAWRTQVRRTGLACGAAMLAAAALVVSPWAIRNLIQFHKPIVATTHGGYTLLLGNNPDYYKFLRTQPWRAVWHADRLDASLLASHSGDEVSEDRREYALAWQTIREQPGTFARASLRRVGALWGVLPHAISGPESTAARLLRYATAVWYLLVLVPTVGAVLSPNARVAVPSWSYAAALAASFTAVHLLYWTDLRMRAPLMPAISLLAAAGIGRPENATKSTKRHKKGGQATSA